MKSLRRRNPHTQVRYWPISNLICCISVFVSAPLLAITVANPWRKVSHKTATRFNGSYRRRHELFVKLMSRTCQLRQKSSYKNNGSETKQPEVAVLYLLPVVGLESTRSFLQRILLPFCAVFECVQSGCKCAATRGDTESGLLHGVHVFTAGC